MPMITKEKWEKMQLWLEGRHGVVPNLVAYDIFRELMEAYSKDQQRVRVGIATIVRKGEAVLLGQRKDEQGKSRGHGTWALPGGHLEYKETVEHCAIREVKEETGLDICNVRPGPYVNNLFEEDGRHYVTLFVTAELENPEDAPEVLEPDKCFEWRWCFGKDDIPEPRFPPLKNFMDQYNLFLRDV